MNDLTCDIGYKSINHAGEQLCGDHVEVVDQEDALCVTASNQSTVRARKNIFAPSFDMTVWQW